VSRYDEYPLPLEAGSSERSQVMFEDSLTGTAPASDVAVSPMDAHLDLGPLTTDQARALTDTIRNAAEVLWVLIARAHAGKAWQSLGYNTWEAYVRAEFDMSRSRSYQILDQARVIAAIESAVPEGTNVHLSESAARDLKGVLEEALPQIKERTAGLTPEEAAEVIKEIVDEHRDAVREDPTVITLIDEDFDADAPTATAPVSQVVPASDVPAGDGVNYAALMSQAPDLSGSDDDFEEYAPSTVVATTETPEPAPAPAAAAAAVDVAKIRRNVNAAHDLYSSLSALAGLPDELDEVVAIIPAERHAQIRQNLERATANLERFAALWSAEQDDENDEQ
jgi:hypothetical protein